MKKILPHILLTIFCLLFFSYKLINVPRGLTIDEAAFGHNAILLSETLHDENGRFLPAFVLSIEGRDWRQPVTQYFITLFFKIFGASIYNLKFTSVIVATLGTILIYILGKRLLGNLGGITTAIFFLTTPIVMIHSHLGLDNIMPIPFAIAWLIFLHLSERHKNLKYLFFSAVSLGIGFYSYKGMRSFVPVWSMLTIIYLSLPFLKLRSKKSLNEILKPTFIFLLGIIPFYLIIPLLEYKYAGAVLGQANAGVSSVYQFLLSYLASFDPSFLFITGDKLPHHSTGIHGMLLLASLPFFIVGLFQVVKKGKFWVLITTSFFLGPILFGFPGSIHRASRLMAMIPSYSLICALGASHLWTRKKNSLKVLFLILATLLAINSYDFLHYYWFSYPKETEHIFYKPRNESAYQTLLQESQKRNLTPYLDYEIVKKKSSVDEEVVDLFARSIYFPIYPHVWYLRGKSQSDLPENAILMSTRTITELETVDTNVPGYFYYLAN